MPPRPLNWALNHLFGALYPSNLPMKCINHHCYMIWKFRNHSNNSTSTWILNPCNCNWPKFVWCIYGLYVTKCISKWLNKLYFVSCIYSWVPDSGPENNEEETISQVMENFVLCSMQVYSIQYTADCCINVAHPQRSQDTSLLWISSP